MDSTRLLNILYKIDKMNDDMNYIVVIGIVITGIICLIIVEKRKSQKKRAIFNNFYRKYPN